MKPASFNMLTSGEIKNMIDGLEYMNDEDVMDVYGFDTVEEAKEVLLEESDRALEAEGESVYEVNGFSCAWGYNSFRY